MNAVALGTTTIRLAEVARFVRGITFKPEDVVSLNTAGSVACMRTKNVQADVDLRDVWAVPAFLVKRDEQYLQAGDVLVSSANSWNLVGKCCWVPELEWRSTFGGFISVLRGDTKRIDARYLYHWFSSPHTQATVRSLGQQTTNISNLNVHRCLNLQLPVPSLPHQRRIAAILDRANALRARRRTALAQLDTLTQSIFTEMFGEPPANPTRLPTALVSDYVAAFQGGKSVDPEDEGAETINRVLKVGAVTWMRYLPAESKPISDAYSPPTEHFVRPGDLLFSRANTSELVGAVAYVHETPANLLLPDKLWRFVWRDPASVEPLFVWALFQTRSLREELGRRASGTSGSMKNISQEKVLGIRTIWPAIDLQRQFAGRLRVIERDLVLQQTSLREFDRLFASLQHRAFRGEL